MTTARMAGLVLAGTILAASTGVFAQEKPAGGAPPARKAAEPPKKEPAPAPPTTGPAVDLRPKYKKGQEIRFKQQVRRADTIQAPGQDGKPMSNTVWAELTAGMLLRVVDASDKEVSLELVTESVKAHAETGEAKSDYDSTKEDPAQAEGEAYRAFRPIVGATMTITLGADGNIKAISCKEPVKPNGILAAHQGLLISPDAVKARWAPILSIKDGSEPARVGQTWKNEETVAGPPVGRIKYITDNTLKSVKGDEATIDIKGSVDLMPMKDGDTLAFKMTDTSITGATVWDTKAGVCKSASGEMKYTLTGNAIGFDVKRASEIKSTLTRVE